MEISIEVLSSVLLFLYFWNNQLWIQIYCYFREQSRDSEVLKSKHEETEAYLSEIEVIHYNITLSVPFCLWNICYKMVLLQTIGQAYDDIQTQNQQLLQQVTERDDYNIKVMYKIELKYFL